MVEISLANGASIVTLVLVLLVATGLVSLFYYRKFGELKRGRWQLLLILRLLAVAIVVLLLFRPMVHFYREEQQKPTVVFLLDTSASMKIADDVSGIPRFAQARDKILVWADRLKEHFSVQVIPFAERAGEPVSVNQLGALTPDGPATSLSRALVAATKVAPRSEMEAVFLFSDGIHNSARKPEEVSSRMQIPVFTIGVGASLKTDVSFRDIQVTGFDCPERMMLNNLSRLKAFVEAVGLAGRVVRVVFTEDGRTIEEQELVLDDKPGPQEVVFEYRPTVKGRHVYAAKIEPLGEEKIVENNERSAAALVVESQIKVLYLEGTLRAEYGAIVDRFLSKDPNIEFYALIQVKKNVFVKRTNMEGLTLESIPSDEATLNQFDVFIIGDLDSSFLSSAQQEAIVNRVKNGGGLIMLGGYHGLGPGGYGNTPIGKILPVELGDRDIGQITDAFLPELTPDGRQHPIFANIVRFFPTSGGGAQEQQLPPLDGCTRVGQATAAATVLAICPVTAERMPVLAVMPVERGRTAVFTGDTTRKWQQVPRVLDQESPFLQFWGQFVRWAAGRSEQIEAKASITAATDKAAYEPDEPIQISAVVRDQRGEGTDKAKVTATIRAASGAFDKVTLVSTPGPGGHYAATYEPRFHGTLEIEVHAELEEDKLDAEKIIVEVGRPYLEFEKLDLDEKTLVQIASDTNGRYSHISAADHLVDQLNQAARKKRIYIEQPLFWPPLFWAAFVVLLTTEWVLRRRFQLR
ncbi:MAG: glutamine amidotransferase [Thermogutta sp.]